jgi:tetratricopeptide (TPR) repeat protein
MLLAGRWDEAQECLTRSMELHRDLGAPLGESLALQRLAELAGARGDYDRAAELLGRGLDIAVRIPFLATHMQTRIYGTQAVHALDQHDVETALRAVEATVDIAAQFGACPGCTALIHPVAAETYAALGRLDEAKARVEAAQENAEQWQSGAWRALAELAQGVVARSASEGAVEHLTAAADLFEEIDWPYPAARCYRLAGQALAERGQTAAARDLLQDALARFEQLGATADVTRTRAALEDLGA